ncbi:MAG: cobalamin biosynthesis protein [Lachnospiraceae bacterium]|nr:cobalamin biosynthesis protein [Lachnospiraceae bacterium]
MDKTFICFTENGKKIIEKIISAALQETASSALTVKGYAFGNCSAGAGIKKPDISLEELTKCEFAAGHAIIFIGAVGIAVRTISPFIKDKLTDSPVIVIDDAGTFVIPILSGHAGGANKLAAALAGLLDAVPVITTSTDVNGAFSADVFAVENHLTIRNREGIRKVSAKALEGKPVTISIKDYPPAEGADIIIADETDREYSLLLSPKKYVLGVGMRKDKDASAFEEFIVSLLSENGIEINDVYALATVDVKENEPALRAFSQKHRIPLISFEAPVLERAKGDFTASDFVKETVGVDNVCERAAYLAAGPGAKIIVKKTKYDGITAAIAQRI